MNQDVASGMGRSDFDQLDLLVPHTMGHFAVESLGREGGFNPLEFEGTEDSFQIGAGRAHLIRVLHHPGQDGGRDFFHFKSAAARGDDPLRLSRADCRRCDHHWRGC